MTTLREHLEAIQEIAGDHSRPNAATAIREHAAAVLEILNESPRDIDTDGVSRWKGPERLVFDPPEPER